MYLLARVSERDEHLHAARALAHGVIVAGDPRCPAARLAAESRRGAVVVCRHVVHGVVVARLELVLQHKWKGLNADDMFYQY